MYLHAKHIVHVHVQEETRKAHTCVYSPEALGKEPFLDVMSGRNFLSSLPGHGTSESRNSITRSTSRTHDTDCGIVDKRSEVEESRFPTATTFQEKSSLTDKVRVILTGQLSLPPSTLAKVTPDVQVWLVVSIQPKRGTHSMSEEYDIK